MSNLLTHSTCNILEAIVTDFSGEYAYDIKLLITGFMLSESIFDTNYWGVLNILDTTGLLEKFPLRGEERLSLEISGNDFNTVKQLHCFVYKISNVDVINSTSGSAYEMHFTSQTSFNARLRKTIVAFDQPISDSAIDLFENTYETIKNNEMEDVDGAKTYKLQNERFFCVEKTDGPVRCLIPNYYAHDAMNFLCTRANSLISESCSYKFFETLDGYYFVSDEYLIKKATLNGTEIETFFYNDNSNNTAENQEFVKRKFEVFKNSTRADSLSDLYSGAYNSNILELDLFERKVNEFKFKYSENKDLFLKSNGIKNTQPSYEKHTDSFLSAVFNDENERKRIFVKDYDSYNNLQIKGDGFVPRIANHRNSYEYILNSSSVDAQIKGRLDLRAGKVINVSVLELTNSSIRQFNKQLSGFYLISNVTHTVVAGELTTSLRLIKFGWDQADSDVVVI